MIIGTAGHVDHGKTSLVRALTGVDTDRLAEEKARGISIELGFAYTRLDDGPGHAAGALDDAANDAANDASEPIGFIDVPGHRKFVQTMIAGAAGIDLGLLVIAADDGPMPQTREHLDILAWLGVPELVVALSKVDAVDDERRHAALREVHELVESSTYANADIVPVSTVSGEGIATLAGVLRGQRGAGASRRAEASLRLAIDRAFVLQGIGLVVTGTCCSGRVGIDDTLTLLPGRVDARVRGIHAQNRAVTEAHAGQRVALNLAGRGIEKSTVHRGDWAVAPSIAIETDRVDVQLAAPPRRPTRRAVEANGAASGTIQRERPFFDTRTWRHVRFHAGAASVNARVALLQAGDAADDAADDADDGACIAQVVFDQPLHLVAGDRFVLRDASGHDPRAGSAAEAIAGSIAGGVVLDVDVPARGRRSPARLAFLQTAAGGDALATLAHAIGASDKGVDLARWNIAHNTAFAAGDLEARLGVRAVGTTGRASAAGSADPAPITLFSPARWDALQARVAEVLAIEHARTPDSVGPGRERLRRMATPSLNAPAFAALIDALKAAGHVSQTGAWLHLSGHRVELSADDRARFERARAWLEGAEANHPPRVRDIARELGEDEGEIRNLFVRLASRGALYKVAHDHFFMPATVRALAQAAAELQQSDGVAKAAAFRDRIRVGRKLAIQILEFFDRVGYTRRLGDEHRIIQPALFDESSDA